MKLKKYCVCVKYEIHTSHTIRAKNEKDAIKKTREFYEGSATINPKTDVWEVW